MNWQGFGNKVMLGVFAAWSSVFFAPSALGQGLAGKDQPSHPSSLVGETISPRPIQMVPTGGIVDANGNVWDANGEQIASPDSICLPAPILHPEIGPVCAPTPPQRQKTGSPSHDGPVCSSPPFSLNNNHWVENVQADVIAPNFFDGVYVKWEVPNPPHGTITIHQVVDSFWDGIADIEDQGAPLLQPVLQWNSQLAGLGWRMANIITLYDETTYSSSWTTVDVYDTVAAAVWLYTPDSYILQWEDVTKGIGDYYVFDMTTMEPGKYMASHFTEAYPVVFEAVGIEACDDFPYADNLLFYDAAVYTATSYQWGYDGQCYGCNPDAGDLECDAGPVLNPACYTSYLDWVGTAESEAYAWDAGDTYCGYHVGVDPGAHTVTLSWQPEP
jgi:hypothetical protein